MSTSSLSEKAKAEFLLAGLRCARLRVQSLQAEIDEVGLALKHNMISPEVGRCLAARDRRAAIPQP